MAIFDSRLGTATPEAVSGTAEEILRAHELGKPVHVWFSVEPLPRNTEPEQLAALNKFRRDLEAVGLLGTYASPDDLMFQVRNAVEHDLPSLGPVVPRAVQIQSGGAVLRARFDEEREQSQDSRGAFKMKTRRQRIIVRNIGSRTAEGVSVELAPFGDLPAPQVYDQETHPNVIPDSEFPWTILGMSGTSSSYNVIMRWQEGEEERSERQAISEL